jgi:hypothetical protein
MGQPDKEREIFVCQRVADEINSNEGTDYRAVPSKSAFPDVILVSDSGKHRIREAEVVSTPQDFSIRYDNKNVRKFERKLHVALEKLGMSDCDILICWSESAIKYGADEKLISELADIIAAAAPSNGHLSIRGVEIYEYSAALSHIVHYVRAYRLPHSALTVHSTCAFWAPSDGRWIEEAVAKKARTYRAGIACKTLLLVIDGLAYIDGEQLAAYRASNSPERIPFAELWVVTMGRAHRLKP